MIDIKCSAPDMLKLEQLTPFQGDLKKRTGKDVKQLKDSIKNEGLLMPFAVWENDSKFMLLDGHGRLTALYELSLVDESILQQPFPCIKVQAESEEQARKALLQITSSYGKITKDGAVKFCATIKGYKAPAINRFVNKVERPHKLKVAPNAETIIRIAVPAERAEEVKSILASINYIKVL